MPSLTDRPLPSFLTDLLDNPPASGAGVHSWIFKTAAALKPWRAADEIGRLISQAVATCGRAVPSREILDAVKNAKNDWQPNGGHLPASPAAAAGSLPPQPKRWPDPDWKQIAAIAATGGSTASLTALSPGPVELSAAAMLKALWPWGDPLLCLARNSPTDAITRRRSEWLKDTQAVASHGLIVPSPMMSKTGTNLSGELSTRCLDNTGPRWFLVIEFDFCPAVPEAAEVLNLMAGETIPRTAPDLCAAILAHLLKAGAPLVLAVHSGGKSVHGWFPTHGAEDEVLRPFFSKACLLGADRSTWVRCQMIRLPSGTRSDGTPQRVLYFNPSLLNAA